MKKAKEMRCCTYHVDDDDMEDEIPGDEDLQKGKLACSSDWNVI